MATATKEPLRWPEGFDGYNTHDKQEEALASDARFKILEWGRRGGKNITGIIENIEYGRAPWRSRWGGDDPSNTKVWWVARSYDQAEKYGFLPMLSAIPNAWIDDIDRDVSRSEPYEIELSNGVRYEFRTYDHPETLQGAGVDKMLIDEADYMKNTLWYDDLEPMLIDTRGAAMFISKPVRQRSYYQILAERGRSSQWPDHFYSHATSADNPFIEEDPEDKRGTMPDAKFRQQYLAELPEDGQVFQDLGENFITADYELQGEVVDGVGEVWAEPTEEWVVPPFSAGVDIARSRDYRVTLVLDSAGQLVYFKRSQNESWDGIKSHVTKVHGHYPGVVLPDATRDNSMIADLWNAGVDIEPVKFTKQEKKSLIENLITAVEQGDLSAPDVVSLDTLYTEMRMLEKEVTRAGYTKYHAPDSGHDDTVDALALANKGLGSVATQGPSTTATIGGGSDTEFGRSEIGQALEDIQQSQQGNPWK